MSRSTPSSLTTAESVGCIGADCQANGGSLSTAAPSSSPGSLHDRETAIYATLAGDEGIIGMCYPAFDNYVARVDASSESNIPSGSINDQNVLNARGGIDDVANGIEASQQRTQSTSRNASGSHSIQVIGELQRQQQQQHQQRRSSERFYNFTPALRNNESSSFGNGNNPAVNPSTMDSIRASYPTTSSIQHSFTLFSLNKSTAQAVKKSGSGRKSLSSLITESVEITGVDGQSNDGFSSNTLIPTASPSPTTMSRINQYLVDLNVDRNAAPWRPTQAQLRWAHFSRKARARETMDRIDRLMKFPSSVSDVDGAHPSDAEDSTADDGDCAGGRDDRGNDETSAESPPNCSRGGNVVISAGRRALLQVSARAYEERKKNMKSYAIPDMESRYHVESKCSETEYEKVAGLTQAHPRGRPCAIDKNEERIRRFEEARRAMAGSLALHRRQPRTIGESQERIRRFEEAYKAMMRATHANCEDDVESVSTRWLEAGCKRWTRDPNIASAVSIDGRLYDDLQRTPTISLKQMNELNYRATRWWTSPRNIRQFCRIGEKNSLSDTLAHVIETDSIETEKNPQEALYIDKMSDIQLVLNGSKRVKAERYAPVGISTLRLLFSGVQNKAGRSPRWNNSRSKNTGGTKAPFLGHQRSHTNTKIRGKVTVSEKRPPRNAISWDAPNDEGAIDARKIDVAEIDNKTKVWSRSQIDVPSFVKSLSNDRLDPKIHGKVAMTEPRNGSSNVASIDEGATDARKTDVAEIDSKTEVLVRSRFPHIDVSNFVKSLFADRIESTIIDTDGAESDVADFHGMHYAAKMRSMLMSPQLITKRYRQALRTIEERNWLQLSYILSANPWLMEMKDVRNDQSLVHTLSLFGGGQKDSNNALLPKQLAQSIIDYEPNVVYKLDVEGNLPLHMASASGNLIMIEELGRLFPGAASVQNHDGLLPLHLAIISCDLFATCIQAVELLLTMFPGAVGVRDNDGNTPLHTAATILQGEDAVVVIDLLVVAFQVVKMENEASPDKSRRCDSSPTIHDASALMAFDTPAQISPDDLCAIDTWKNNAGETPLTASIKSRSGRQVVEALLSGNGKKLAALERNSDSLNSLHLALDSGFFDAEVVLSILKSTPHIVTISDGEGMLPIKIACRNSLPQEIILAIAIIDLPIDLGSKDRAILRDGFGASWSYLICESDDAFLGVVKEILALCTHPQKEALSLALATNSCDSRTVAACATPLCKEELRRSLMFLRRFKILGGQKSHSFSFHAKQFDAIDYGANDDPPHHGKKISLVYYAGAKSYAKYAEHLQGIALDTELFGELHHFTLSLTESNAPIGSSLLYCISADKPMTSLADVTDGMSHHRRIENFRTSRYIMQRIAKALSKLHGENIIHGSVHSHNVGKFGQRWQLTGLPGSVVTSELFAACRLGLHSPPEAFVLARCKTNRERTIATLAPSLVAEPTVDVWAFGKLLYEVLMGESLFKDFMERGGNIYASKCILTWDENCLEKVSRKLLSEGIAATVVDLILSCLSPLRSTRFQNMSDIIDHPFWRDEDGLCTSVKLNKLA